MPPMSWSDFASPTISRPYATADRGFWDQDTSHACDALLQRSASVSEPTTRSLAAMAAPLNRKGFYEAMAFTQLDDGSEVNGKPTKNFISNSRAWKPGEELPWDSLRNLPDFSVRQLGPGAFGGHVYAQASLAAARVVEEEDKEAPRNEKLAIHSIQGVFTNPGLVDRPYLYHVQEVASGKSFCTRQITVRQPDQPSSNPKGPFPTSDAQLPMANVCFTSIVTFKRPIPPIDDVQLSEPPQTRFASILNSRAPDEWEPSPQADIDKLRELFPNAGHGAFPIVDMYKVDMRGFNEGKPIPERRELLLYRLLKPIPKEDVNAHIVCHAYEADRNGLLMPANYLGYGYNLGTVASLSYSFYIHVNGEEAVMDGEGWWIQEVGWPRITAGRAMLETRIWGPDGKHVASGYQDGVIFPQRKSPKAPKEQKL
ncbi:thioesterase-like superfamily-domain-containing protein [Stachybotrys elegans]|uniref:Thioesterase-like superfamily-domain-containing protein n=1 Tax=Stachybotrys elegans TaxID=80388 RepID=A0A8K0SFA2_9HYPO|nr:thioesterase-like superfamily-domain-containing protein [Stachybotrys elegans]